MVMVKRGWPYHAMVMVADHAHVQRWRAQTKAGLRSLRPGIQLPTVDPTWMQPRRSAAHRPRIKRKQLVDVEWREDRQNQVRDALLQLLRLGDQAHGCCIPPHWSGWCALSGPQPSPELSDRG